MTHFFTLTPGTDNFTGLAGDYNEFQFTPATLQSTDTVTGGATGSFLDILVATAGGTILASQFSHVTLVEQLNLSSGGNNVTLANSLVAGTAVGYFAVVDGGGNDTVDASGITATPIVFFAGAGSDTFKGGGGNDAVFIAPADLSSADNLQGGAGLDNLYLNAAGTVAAAAFTNVTGFEGLSLSSGGNAVTLTNGLVAGASYFSVNDGGGNDNVDASAVTATPVVFFAGAGADTFKGGSGNDAVYIATADLTSADNLQGGAGIDNLYLTTAGPVAGSAFSNVTGFEGLVLSGLGNNVTLTNSLVAGSSNGTFAVADGAGNDTIDASGVTNATSVVVFASSGADTFKGGNGLNGYAFAVADLTSADTVTGGSAVDNLIFTTAGPVAASAFTNVTGIEALILANGANNVTLTNGLVAGTSIGYFAVAGGTGNDVVNASGVTNGTAIAFNGTTGGNDSFTGGNGNDSFLFAAGQLTSGDTVIGGGGADTLWMTTAGTTNTTDLAGVSGIEGVYLQNGGTFHLANGITAVAGLAATGSAAVDNFDASAVTTYSVSFSGNGGADALTGGSQNDIFYIPDSAFAAINGNGGIDRITLTGASQSFNLTANVAKITNLEVIDLNSSLNSTLTLAGTDIAQVNSAGASLYVVGNVDDTVNAGNGYTQIASGVVNNAVAPGHTFYEYQHSSGSLLFIDSAITAQTASTGNGAASVAEGTPAGATVFDAHQAGATNYVLGGPDAARFSVDSNGHISFNSSPNFETPLDQGTNNVYDLTVTLSNGTATPNFVETVTITVTDVAPSAPADSDTVTANSVLEGAAGGTYVGITALSSDPAGPAPTYTLANDASGKFAINSGTGAVTVASGAVIDYETAPGPGHSYGITIRATAGALSTTQDFTIIVGNVNEAPAGADKTVTTLESTAYVFSVADFGFSDPSDSVAPNSLLSVKMTTVPAPGAGTFKNNGVAVNTGDFVLASDIAAGHLVFTPTAHSTGAPEASFTFQVKDNGGTANGGVDLDQSANTISINVDAVNDAPVNSVPGSQAVNEEATLTFSTGNGNAITISDVDAGSGNETVTLSVSSGTLALGPTAGLVSFTDHAASISLTGTVANVNAAMNGLTYTGNLDFNGQDTLVVSTSDNGNTGSGGAKTDSDNVTINVAAVNDAPVNHVPGPQSVDEDTALVFSGGNAISISDVDALSGSETVTLSVGGGTLTLSGTAGLVFGTGDGTADATMTFSGTVSAINAALNGLSYQGNANVHGSDTLHITTHDNGNTGGGDLSDSDTVSITVNAVNDAPTASNLSQSLTIAEDAAATPLFTVAPAVADVDSTTLTATLTLTDPAAGVLTGGGFAATATPGQYSFSGTQAAVNAALAAVSYDSAQDFNGPVSVDVLVDDGASGPQGTNPTGTVAITVNAVNDAPTASNLTQSLNIDEDAAATALFTVAPAVADVDSTNLTATLSLSDAAAGTLSGGGFAATATPGQYSFTGTQADVNAALAAVSFDSAPDFNGPVSVGVLIDDGASGPQGTNPTGTVSITVNAVNDAPTASNLTQSLNIDEDAAATPLFTVAPAVADVDSANLTATLTLSDAAAGVLTGGGFAATATPGQYSFTGTQAAVNAALAAVSYDSAQDFNGSVSVDVLVDDGASGPQGTNPTGAVSITVNAVNDAPTLSAHDLDPLYAPGGVQLFNSASVSVGPADEAAQNIKQLVLTVSNVDGTGTTDHMSIDGTDVFLTDGNVQTGAGHGVDISVSLLAGTATVTISKPVGDIPAADVASIVDGLTYTNDDVTNGELARHVTLTSIQDDGGGAAPNVDTRVLSIDSTVTFNQAPAIDSDGGGATFAKSIAENTTAVTTVHATDPDGGPSAVSYSIVPGDDATKFGIDAAGHLAFLAAPNFENPTDVGDTAGNNTYVVTVRASDSVAFDDQTITVTVTDVNEAPVITSDGGGATASLNVNENSTTVTTVQATDQDTPAQTLTYSLAGGADQAKFAISPSSGALTFIAAPNFEAPTDTGLDNGYDVIVRATDNGAPNLHDDQAITVHVQNVNEAPDTAAVSANGTEDQTSPSYIAITITGTDPDTTSGDHVASFHITNIPSAATQGTLYSNIGLTTVVTEGADVAATGNAATLYFVPNANFNTHAGAVTFNAASTDTNGLTDATPATETINISAVNDAPVNTAPANSDLGTAFSNTNFAVSGFSVADVDAGDSAPGDIHVTLAATHGNVSVTLNGTSVFSGTNGSHSVTLDGTVAQVNAALSSLIYHSDDGYTGTDTLTLHTDDLGHSGSGGAKTADASVNIGIIPQVFVIDNTPAGAGNNGSLSDPYNSIAAFNTNANDGSGDYIYINAGTYAEADGINLLGGEHLYGQGQTLTFTNPVTGQIVTIGTGSSGNTPIIQVTGANQHGIDLGADDQVTGLNVQTTLGNQIGIHDSGASVGTATGLTVSDVDVTGAGEAVNIAHGGLLNVAIDTLTSTGSTTNGIHLGTNSGGTALTGSFSAGTGANAAGSGISGSTGTAFLVGDGAGTASTGGTATITFGGAISANNAGLIDIQDHATGAVTLSGTLTHTGTGAGIVMDDNSSNFTYSGSSNSLNTGASTAINITDQTGGTVAFSGPLNIDTTTGGGVNIGGTTTGATFNFTGGSDTIDTTTGTGFSAAGGGTVSVTGSGNTITTTGAGTALNLSGVTVGAGGVNFDTTTSAGGTNNVNLSSVTGTGAINLGTGSLSGASGVAFNVSGGTGSVDYNGSIAKTSDGRVIDVQNHTTGTLSFDGTVSSTSASDGINLTGNTSATIGFSNTLTLTTSSSGTTGFNASGGGTVTATGSSSTISSGSGTAASISGTTIGAGGVKFQSVSANGAVNGIVLNGTGAGTFTVTGDGSQTSGLFDRDGSGGTIQSTTHDAVLLTNANATLRQLNITNAGWDGVQATGSGNVTLSAVDINHPGNANPVADGSTGNASGFGGGNGFYVENGTGTYSFDNNSRVINWQSSQSNAVLLHNTNTNFTSLTVDHALISTSATGASGVNASLFGTTNGQVSLTNSEFTLIDQNAAQILNNGSGTIRAIVQGNNFHDADATSGDGNNTLFLSNSANGALHFTIGGAGALGNTFHNLARLTTLAGVIQVDAAGGDGSTPSGGIINGTITNNNIWNDSGFVNGRRAIDVQVEADSHNLGQLAVAITNNTVNNVQGTAIHVSVVSVGGGSSTDGNWTITGNSLGAAGTNNGIRVGLDNTDSASAIEFKTNVDSFTSGADTTNKLLISNNTAVNSANNATGGTLDITNLWGSAGSGTTSVLQATITNNTLTNIDTGGTGHVLDVLNSSAGDGETTNLNITGNNTTLGASTAGEIRLRDLAGTFNIQGGVGSVSGNNNGDTVVAPNSYGTVASVPLPIAPSFQLAAGGEGPGASDVLTAALLAPVLAEAIQRWADAGATADQLTALGGVHVSIADLDGAALAQMIGDSTIIIDSNAAGWGWFVDPTPAQNSEFDQVHSSTEHAASSGEASGHMDLVTVVEHELGHVLGLQEADQADDLMSEFLDVGVRRVPGDLDIAGTQQVTIAKQAAEAEAALPSGAAAPDNTPVVAGTSGNDTINAGHGGNILAGGAGADKFVFGPDIKLDAPAPAQLTHVADYHAAEGDTFDFSAITSQFHNSSASDALVVRAVEDASGKFATLQLDHNDPMGLPSAPNWVDVAQIDGAHAGDAVNVLIDNHLLHVAQIHVDLLV